jgi:hypothetical protein
MNTIKTHLIEDLGIEVPYIPFGNDEQKPSYIGLLEGGNYEAALRAMRLVLAKTIHNMASDYYTVRFGTIRTCQALDADEYSIDPNGSIVIQESMGSEREWDSDGDVAYVAGVRRKKDEQKINEVMRRKLCAALNRDLDDDRFAVIKWPITKPVPTLRFRKWSSKLDTQCYRGLTMEEAKKILVESAAFNPSPSLWEIFETGHAPSITGLVTKAHDNYALWSTRKERDLATRQRLLHAHPSRQADIEGDLKKKSKTEDHAGKDTTHVEILRHGITLDPVSKLLTSSQRRLNGLDDETLEILDYADIEELVVAARTLDVDFDVPSPGDGEVPEREYGEENLYDFDSGLMLTRLKNLGVLRTMTIEGHPFPGRNVKVFSIHDNKGNAVALVNTKRPDSPVNYVFAVPPIIHWDADSKKVVFSDPEEFLMKFLRRRNFEVTHPEYGSFGIWPRNRADVERYPIKAAMFQALMTEFVGAYGFDVTLINGFQSIGPHVVQQTVTVDYTGWENKKKEFMKMILEKLEAADLGVTIDFVGGKTGGSGTVRKYGIAYPETYLPLWTKNKPCSPRRSGNILSQLARSVAIPEKMKVVIVRGMSEKNNPGNTQQVLITPSGVAKQELTGVFMDEIHLFPTQEEANEYQQVNVRTLSGDIKVVWKGEKRPTRRIGKIITPFGDKFVPGETAQARTKDGELIDLIWPIEEMIAKDTANVHLEGAREEIILWNGKEFRALVCEVMVCRNTDGASNIPNGWKKWFRVPSTVDGHGIRVALNDCGATPYSRDQSPLLDFAKSLQEVIQSI